MKYLYLIIIIVIKWSLRQARQSEFSSELDLVFPISVSSSCVSLLLRPPPPSISPIIVLQVSSNAKCDEYI